MLIVRLLRSLKDEKGSPEFFKERVKWAKWYLENTPDYYPLAFQESISTMAEYFGINSDKPNKKGYAEFMKYFASLAENVTDPCSRSILDNEMRSWEHATNPLRKHKQKSYRELWEAIKQLFSAVIPAKESV